MNNIAKFEKVSEKQFLKDIESVYTTKEYDDIILPKRSTNGSAGYDIYSPITVYIAPHDTLKFPTGIRCKIDDGWVMLIVPRSSFGIKKRGILLNTVGVIDSDYYNADNEGHIWAAIKNDGDEPLVIENGERFLQAVFVPFGIADEEEVTTERTGGIGSTGK